MNKNRRTARNTAVVLLALSLSPLALCAQKESKTAQAMAKQGMANVWDYDKSIQVSLMYGRADNFTGTVLYDDLRQAYLHPKAAAALAKAQKRLKQLRPDLSLKIYDAARPMSVQQKMYRVVRGTSKSIYVSNPRNGGGLHNYGMAVDITLCKVATGDTIPMGTIIDHLGILAHIDNEAQMVSRRQISREAKRNRELLRSVMRHAGFTPLSTEWWHFNFVSRATAKKYYKVIK